MTETTRTEETPEPDTGLSVALVLKREARSPEAADRLERLARELGMEPMQSGRATMTVRVSRQRFQELFGGTPTEAPARPPGDSDFGAAAGVRYDGEMVVPEALAELVESVSVEPPASRLDRP